VASTESAELAELRHHYGEAYEIGSDPWRAKRRDGKGGWLTAETVEALYELIRADYRACPVPRDAE
jgi:hypothetical protein